MDELKYSIMNYKLMWKWGNPERAREFAIKLDWSAAGFPEVPEHVAGGLEVARLFSARPGITGIDKNLNSNPLQRIDSAVEDRLSNRAVMYDIMTGPRLDN